MTVRRAATKRSILGSFTVHVFHRMAKDHHIKKYTTITCCAASHDCETDNTITWLYHTWLPNRQGNGMTKDHTAYICSRCAYRTIREYCETPILATRHMFKAGNGSPVAMARYNAGAQRFIAMGLPSDRVTSKFLTDWILSLYSKVV